MDEKKLILIRPRCQDRDKTKRLEAVLEYALEGITWKTLETVEEVGQTDLRGKRILFAIELGDSGINLEYVRLLKSIRIDRNMFEGSLAGIIVDGSSEMFTKSVARHLEFSANRAGCAFPGRPLVEGTETLQNFSIIARNLSTDNYNAYRVSARELIQRLVSFQKPFISHPNILVLHSGDPKTSNTLVLWELIQRGLDADITQISLRDGQIHDCHACAYDTCLHFGERSKCFYGGVITKEVFPAILACDALVMVCPNYNDAVGANLTAFINRLTALFRVHRFFDKRLYAVIISGYSGSDIVAEQLISALNMNKSFYLPPRFAMMQTANAPGSVLQIQRIQEKAAGFAAQMMHEFVG